MTLKYEYDKVALKATVCGVEDCGTNVVIPATVEYYKKVYKVTSIGKSAFEGCKGLTSVVIPNSVTSIGDTAFTRCESLTSIEIPQSVTRIHERAFLFCESLSSIKVDPGNTIYDSRDNCNAIIETQTNTLIHGCNRTVIPGSVTSIGKNAFHYRKCLTNVVFPAGLKSIGEGAFMYCSRLASLEIPDSVTSIGSFAFKECSALNRIEVDSGNTVYDSRNNCNAIIETRTNALIKGGNMTVIPNGVTSIGNDAFSGCSNLTSIEIPNSVTSIETEAFCRCSSLTSIEIPNSVTSIGDFAFSGCRGLKKVVIGDGVITIGKYAFNHCYPLTSIAIPNSVTNIGSGVFESCTGLTSIVIPNSVTSIGNDAFFGCSNLTSIEIPNSVTSIGSSAFYGTAWYNNQPGGVVYAGRVLYKYKGTMPENTSIVVREGTAGIVRYAFDGCKGLTSVVIPNSVTSIGERAFYDCYGLTSVQIPSCVEKIHEYAFGGIPNLQVDIYNEEGEVLIHPNAFRGDAKINYLGKKKVKEDKTTKVEKTSNETNDKKEEQAPVIDLDKLIDAVVADGVITDKERSVILKKATAAGYDADEVEILLDGKLAEKQNAEKVVTKEPKKAPAKKEAAPVTEVVTPEEKSGEGGRNYSKYSVNGEGRYGKGRMVEAVVKKYVELNPDTTVQKLKEVFPERLQGSNFIKDSTETITDMKRYYEATLPGGAKFYISNQWGTQTDAFMEYVNNSVDGITVTKL